MGRPQNGHHPPVRVGSHRIAPTRPDRNLPTPRARSNTHLFVFALVILCVRFPPVPRGAPRVAHDGASFGVVRASRTSARARSGCSGECARSGCFTVYAYVYQKKRHRAVRGEDCGACLARKLTKGGWTDANGCVRIDDDEDDAGRGA